MTYLTSTWFSLLTVGVTYTTKSQLWLRASHSLRQAKVSKGQEEPVDSRTNLRLLLIETVTRPQSYTSQVLWKLCLCSGTQNYACVLYTVAVWTQKIFFLLLTRHHPVKGSQGCHKIRFFYKWNCWVLALRLSQNWAIFKKSSKLKENYQKNMFSYGFLKNVQFWLSLSAQNKI